MATYPGGGSARDDDPDTSHEAAERINATGLEAEVLKKLVQYGPPVGVPLCVVQLWKYLPDLSIDTVSPRMKNLVRKRLARCLGKQPRGNRYGNVRNQFVYEATERGVALIRNVPQPLNVQQAIVAAVTRSVDHARTSRQSGR